MEWWFFLLYRIFCPLIDSRKVFDLVAEVVFVCQGRGNWGLVWDGFWGVLFTRGIIVLCSVARMLWGWPMWAAAVGRPLTDRARAYHVERR